MGRLSVCLRLLNTPGCGHNLSSPKLTNGTACLIGATWSICRHSTTQAAPSSRKRLNIRKLIGRVQVRGKDYTLRDSERTWLRQKGYDETEVNKWLRVTMSETAEDALTSIDATTPVFLLLQTFRKPTTSRYGYYRLVRLFQSSSTKFDDISWYTGYRALLKLAVALDPSLLKLLEDSISMVPKSFSSYTFNRLLKTLSTERSRHPQTSITQMAIVQEMTKRQLQLNKEGYEALLYESIYSHKQYEGLRQQMSAAGHNPYGSAHRLHENIVHKAVSRRSSYTHLLSQLETAPSMEQRLKYMQEYKVNFSDPHLWSDLLVKVDRRSEVLKLCVKLLESHEITLTTVLTGTLIQGCKSSVDKQFVERICRVAVDQGVVFDTFVWTEYIKRLIWSRKVADVLAIVTNEPGGNHLLDMSSAIRRDPRIWTVIVHQLNGQVKRGHCDGVTHARFLGEIRLALDRFRVMISRSLLWSLMEAALLSGPRRWAGKHSCDSVVSYFKDTIDLHNEPWKLRADKALWTSYMKVLVANEETGLLSAAMEHMLSDGTLPDGQQLRLFALAIWEAGSIEAVQHWQTYFESQDNMQSSWPSSEETFRYRSILAKHELRWFYD